MKGIIAAGDKNTALAGALLLERGGNAFDAAVAAVFSAAVTEPALTSCGGGGFLLSFDSSGEAVLYDFFVNVPSGKCKEKNFYPIYVDFGDAVQEFHIGCSSVAVPGTVAGLLKVHEEKGNLPLSEVLSPAISYAEKGVKLSDLQLSFVRLLKPIFTATEGSRRIFAKGGELLSSGVLVNADYANFLKQLSSCGEDLFYRGEVAEKISKMCQENGGLITLEDLSAYTVIKRKPLRFKFRDFEVLTNPPPSVGGILIAFTLKLLEDQNIGSWGSFNHVRSLVESLNVTSLFRREAVDADPHDEVLSSLINDEALIGRFKEVLKNRIDMWGSTTHVSVMDAEGNVVSVTTTNGEGSGWIVPETGVMLNNMLGEEDLNPGGFFSWPEGVRLPSMMSPTVVLKDGEPVLCLGSAGSNRIRSAIVQVTLNSLIFKMGISDSVKAPRIHYENGTVYVEPGYDEELLKLVDRFYNTVVFSKKSLFFGGVQAVSKDFDGAGDDRRGGYVIRVEG
jgi:gamma-glutamyltranspeptidase/glutathione hydrolase